MKAIIFSLPGNETLTQSIAKMQGIELGIAEFGIFPDGELKQRIQSNVKNKSVYIVCNLFRCNDKFIALYFFSKLARSLGAKSIHIIAPYLAYMRQDKIFSEGEGLTSHYMANFISSFADELITVDPHLHRIQSLDEIFTIATCVLKTDHHLATWIQKNIKNPLLIGPDSESEQWVKAVSEKAKAAYLILEKVRTGDRNVDVSLPEIAITPEQTPVLVDDIVSTGRTMIETIKKLKKCSPVKPICIAIHAAFETSAYEKLLEAGAAQVISCNTIPHESNAIIIDELFVIKNGT